MRKGIGALGLIVIGLIINLHTPDPTISQTITLNWGPNPEKDIAYYAIYKGMESNSTTQIAQVPATASSYIDSDIAIGNSYYYRITAVDSAGNTSEFSEEILVATSVVTDSQHAAIPEEFELSQNYPNPFNPETTFRYTVAKGSEVSLIIYDMMGREVKTLVERFVTPGRYKAKWDGTNEQLRRVASGVYVARLIAEEFTQVRKILLQK